MATSQPLSVLHQRLGLRGSGSMTLAHAASVFLHLEFEVPGAQAGKHQPVGAEAEQVCRLKGCSCCLQERSIIKPGRMRLPAPAPACASCTTWC